MRSMRARLLFTSIVPFALLAVVLGILLHELVRAELSSSLDKSLAARARTLTALIEQDREGIQLEWLDPEDMERARPALPEHFILRATDGRVISSAGSVADFEWPVPKNAAFGTAALDDGSSVRYFVIRFTPKTGGADIEPPPLDLLVAESFEGIEYTLERLRFWMLMIGLMGGSLGATLLSIVVTLELVPLGQLARRIRLLGTNLTEPRIKLDRTPLELVPVVKQLNELLERLDAARTREREFTAGAAHELRTPLAGIRAKLDLALSRDRSLEEHRQFERESLEIALGMQGVVERLLNLARLEAGEVLGEPQVLAIKPLIERAWEPFAEQAKQRELTVAMELDEHSATVDADALAIVLNNLFENATTYADQGGRIVIRAAVADSILRIRVSNTASGLSDQDAKRALEPFWRSDRARGAAGVHAGLGLTLCSRLVKAMGGELQTGVADGHFVAELKIGR